MIFQAKLNVAFTPTKLLAFSIIIANSIGQLYNQLSFLIRIMVCDVSSFINQSNSSLQRFACGQR
jgi:hypothetical protein